MDHIWILNFRLFLNVLISFAWWISHPISTIFVLEPCDLQLIELRPPVILLLMSGVIPEIAMINLVDENYPSMFESRTWYFSIVSKIVLAKIVLVISTQLFDAKGAEPMIDRLFQYDTICHRINGTYDFEYCIDPKDPPRCATIVPGPWTIFEMIIAFIVLEFVVCLSIYSIARWKSRRDRNSGGCILFQSHRSSNWWHQRIDFDGDWHDHDELVTALTDCANDWISHSCFWAPSFIVETIPIVDLNSTSTNKTNMIDRLIYSMVTFQCGTCRSDDGIYLLTISEFLRKYRLVKITSTSPYGRYDEGDRVLGYIHDGLVMCVFKGAEDQTARFLLYNISDSSKREFDTTGVPELEGAWRFWCLKDDGRDTGREIKNGATYIRVIYGCKPMDQFHVGFAIRQSLLEIPSDVDGEIVVNRLQEVKYGSNLRFTDHCRLIRTSRGEVGVIGELIDSNMTTGDNDQEIDGIRYTTCVVYSPETRRLSAIGDYEKYLDIDPLLRQYFDRNFHEYESMRSNNFSSMRRIKIRFLCPQMLTDARGTDVLVDNGAIRNIDFEPRSLKWLCLSKFVDAYGKEFYKNRVMDWVNLTGVDLDKHFWD